MKTGVDIWSFHNTMSMRRMDMPGFIAKCGEVGADGLCIDYLMLTDELKNDASAMKALLEEHGLELVLGFGLPQALPGLVLKFFDAARVAALEYAAALGVKVMRVAGGVIVPKIALGRTFHLTLNRRDEIRRVTRRMTAFAKEAAGFGVSLAMENHTDYRLNEIIEIVERVGSENFGVTFDTGNALSVGEDPIETAARLAPFSLYTHIKDMDNSGVYPRFARLGEGVIDIPAVLGELKKADYQGLYSIEVDYTMVELWKDEEAAVVHAIDYIRAWEGSVK